MSGNVCACVCLLLPPPPPPPPPRLVARNLLEKVTECRMCVCVCVLLLLLLRTHMLLEKVVESGAGGSELSLPLSLSRTHTHTLSRSRSLSLSHSLTHFLKVVESGAGGWELVFRGKEIKQDVLQKRFWRRKNLMTGMEKWRECPLTFTQLLVGCHRVPMRGVRSPYCHGQVYVPGTHVLSLSQRVLHLPPNYSVGYHFLALTFPHCRPPRRPPVRAT